MFPEKGNLFQQGLNLFRPKPEPKELVRKWQSMLRTETRRIDSQIREIQREQKVAQKQVKEAATRGDLKSARVIAKELVRTKRAITQLYTNKAHMIGMGTQLQEQLAMVKVAGSLSKSTVVMKIINDMMNVHALNQTMMEMSREMMKAGIIDEMMEESLDSALDTDEMEEETEEEVDKILQEIAGETMAQMAAAPKARKERPTAVEAPAEDEDDLAARLDAIRS